MRVARRILAPWMILLLSACSEAAATAEQAKPAVVEELPGRGLSRIVLTESAASRLDIQTAAVAEDEGRLMVPSSAVIIDAEGHYWVYTNPEPLVYVRAQLEGAWEEGTTSYFTSGVAPGTAVVVVGVPELYGTEYGIGK